MRRLSLTLAISAAAVVTGLAAMSAFGSAFGNVTFFSGGGGSAAWVAVHGNAHSAVQLSVPASGDYAGIELKHISAIAPTSAPTFTTDQYAAGSPRWVIEFVGGAHLFGYPSQFGSQWEVAGCSSDAPNNYTDYATALGELQGGTQADGSSCGGNVTHVDVVADGSGGTPETDTISSLVYAGTAYIG